MRTISENMRTVQEPAVWEKVPVFYPQRKAVNNKSCFYEPGAEKTATFGEYTRDTTSLLVQRIRKHEYV